MGSISETVREAVDTYYRELRTGFAPVWDDLGFDIDHDRFEELLEFHADRFADRGYSIDTVRLYDDVRDEEGTAGRYSGRVMGRAQLQSQRSQHMPILAHELGHDVESELARHAVPEAEYGLLVRRTYSETFAYLNMMEAAEELDLGDRSSPASPFDWSESRVWDVLDPALSIELANRRIGGYLEISDALEDGDTTEAYHWADEIAAMPPDTTDPTGGWLREPGTDDHMLLDAVGYDELDERRHALREVLGSLEHGSERAVADAVELVHRGDSEALSHQLLYGAARDRVLDDDRYDRDRLRLRAAIGSGDLEQESRAVRREIVMEEADPIREAVAEWLVDDLRTREHAYCEYLEGIEDPVEAVLDGIRPMDYGDAVRGEETGYDTYVDLPHTLGHELAEAMHEHGYGTHDILDDPDRYADVVEDAVRYTVETQLTDRRHDRGRMLEYALE